MTKELYQHGSLRICKRVRGPSVWEFRYWKREPDGRRRMKTLVAGSLDEYPTEAAIREKLHGLLLEINTNVPHRERPRMSMLLDRFVREEHLLEIVVEKKQVPEGLHYSSARGYLTVVNKYLRPRWGEMAIEEVKPMALQQWLRELPVAPKTRANIRALLHRLYERAMLWELISTQRNPIELIEVKGAGRRRMLPTVLTLVQFQAIRDRLEDPLKTMVSVAQCTGLRVSEVLALQWRDFDFEGLTFKVSRGIVNGRVDTVKTEFSEDFLPLDPELAKVLLAWREKSPPTSAGWVFANPATSKPYYSSYSRPSFKRVSEELGIRFGWHTFRHTYRSWLDATGAPIGVQQKLMRHAQVATTMNIYGNALMDSKREANLKIVRMVFPEVPAA